MNLLKTALPSEIKNNNWLWRACKTSANGQFQAGCWFRRRKNPV